MTQLTYNEAFDPYHAVFRFLRINLACGMESACPFEKLRIVDFYILFPFRLQQMRFFDSDKNWRKISKSYEDRAPYGILPNDTLLFSRMEPFQRAAATSLAHAGYISAEAWNRNQIEFTETPIPEDVSGRCHLLNESMSDVISVLCKIIHTYPLNGRNGLKDRTGLLEYRYDPI